MQGFIPEWKDYNKFNTAYRKVEALYGREVKELDIERAYARYVKIIGGFDI